ncbi:hypothetical protein CSB45_16080 [candidate division KSB3 bacterium]|uniref:Uncharacterized protein n=1 Tax=candidate division KSB3 bacterium TaxID=2044937 RepID=A0A2G6E102_9BACT|nr:MAG: hypothetical protein CSB45_16080 [candidate division KSB3 bacterium]
MSILKKKIWAKAEYEAFINNVKYLADKNGTSIGQLQRLIGRHNIFRKDVLRPSDKLITKISEFFKVPPEWLCENHGPTPAIPYGEYQPTHKGVKGLCHRLGELRGRIGFKNAKSFSEDLGINYSTYVNYEKNVAPPYDLLLKIHAKYPGVIDFHWLITGEERQDQPTHQPVNLSGLNETDIERLNNVAFILRQQHPLYTAALEQNIDAFHAALKNENKRATLGTPLTTRQRQTEPP